MRSGGLIKVAINVAFVSDVHKADNPNAVIGCTDDSASSPAVAAKLAIRRFWTHPIDVAGPA